MDDTSRAIESNLRRAALIVGALAAAVAVGMHLPLDGAVVAVGTVTVEGKVKTIQHPTGGIIGQIQVEEGSKVAAGELLLRLDPTVRRVNLDIVLNALRAERARFARLEALRDGRQTPVFPADLTQDAASAGILLGETKLTQLQFTAQGDQKRGLLQRIEQLRQEAQGLKQQQTSYAGQLEIVRADLADLRPLYERGNIQRPRISALEREALRNQGAVGDVVARTAQTEAKIIETELQISQSGHDFVAGVVKKLRETETRISELAEKRIAAEDHLQRLEIRAPLAGRVHQLAVHTIGGVIAPSDVLMQIVPENGEFIVDLRVKPSDVDQLSVGQETRLRFSAFGRDMTAELQGVLFRVGADLTQDRQAGHAYYSASIRVLDTELAKLGDLKLLPGMPAEAFIKTGQRTIASYLVKPLGDQMQRGLRER